MGRAMDGPVVLDFSTHSFPILMPTLPFKK